MTNKRVIHLSNKQIIGNKIQRQPRLLSINIFMKKRLITKKQSREREDKQVSYYSIEQANHRT